jgi:hypothetical protein
MIAKRIRCAGFAGAAMLATAVYGQTLEIHSDAGAPEPGFSYKFIAEHGAMETQTVAGAPYSADQATTTTQVLPDGNRIVHASTAKVYRDTQGRTRVEHTLGSIGPVGSQQPHTMIMINDPVARVQFHLEQQTHSAFKTTSIEAGTVTSKHHVEQMVIDGPHTATTSGFAMGGPEGGPGLFVLKSAPVPDQKKTTEDLGKQTMEGLQVTGTRTTVTVPAGGEGNEQPMQIVDEQWYSPDLHTNIKTVHTDPRMGQTVFTVTNVNRANPDASLFKIPADYELVDGPPMPKVLMRDLGPPSIE